MVSKGSILERVQCGCLVSCLCCYCCLAVFWCKSDLYYSSIIGVIAGNSCSQWQCFPYVSQCFEAQDYQLLKCTLNLTRRLKVIFYYIHFVHCSSLYHVFCFCYLFFSFVFPIVYFPFLCLIIFFSFIIFVSSLFFYFILLTTAMSRCCSLFGFVTSIFEYFWGYLSIWLLMVSRLYVLGVYSQDF